MLVVMLVMEVAMVVDTIIMERVFQFWGGDSDSTSRTLDLHPPLTMLFLFLKSF